MLPERIEPEPQDFDLAEIEQRGVDAILREGARLFDAGSYEAAHEEFERLWLANEAADAEFFKGLVQAAICLHHFQRGNLEGARKLYSGHRRYLAAFTPRHRGLEVERLLDAMADFLRPCLRGRPGDAISFDAGRAPRMELTE